MRRRDLLTGGLIGGSLSLLGHSTQAAEPQAKRVLVIDCHSHAGKGMNYGQPDARPSSTFNDPQWILDKQLEAGIDRSIIFPIANETYEQANEEIAGYVRQHPDRLIGFAKHDAKTEAGRIRQMLAREVKELGLKGLKLHCIPSQEMCQAAAELRIPILVHPPRVADLLPMVEAFPTVNFILAHLGSFASRDYREHLAAIQATGRIANLYLETSGVVYHPYLEQAARELSAEKLLFGSDGPLVDPRVELYKVRLLKLPPEKEAKVLSGNILRLLAS